MSNLDDKLIKIFENYVDSHNDFTGTIQEVKQAFAEEGYVPFDKMPEYEFYVCSLCGNHVQGVFKTAHDQLHKDAKPTMTGQEWYDRFKEMLKEFVGDARSVRTSSVISLAKKAAGLDK